MILDGIPASEVSDDANTIDKAVGAFIKFIEKKLDFTAIRNTHSIPKELVKPLQLAARLREKGVITSFKKNANFPDVPHLFHWSAVCADPTNHQAGGTTFESSADALYAALSEAQERYIWFTQKDYFLDPRVATFEEIQNIDTAISPLRYAGFSEAERAKNPDQMFDQDTKFLWVKAKSLVSGRDVFVPAQTICGAPLTSGKEPLLRPRTTIGLATWPTRTGARLGGALEAIERDAYTIQWFNQLSLPRIPHAHLCENDPALARILESCTRYRLRPHVVSLITDAPTHVVMVVLEDLTDNPPRFTVGLNARQDLGKAVRKALTEALRSHRSTRIRINAGNMVATAKMAADFEYRERLDYWAIPENAKHLEFMIAGKETIPKSQNWEKDGEEEHLQRITDWCRLKGYECLAVSLGNASQNFSGFYIEVVSIPELLPAYLHEKLFASGGRRWREIPGLFGIEARKEAFSERPHPFS